MTALLVKMTLIISFIINADSYEGYVSIYPSKDWYRVIPYRAGESKL